MVTQQNKQADDRQREADLAEAVMQYLLSTPRAMDTLEGIAEWWVMRRQVRVELDLMVNVLRQLSERGLLEQIGSGKDACYRLTRK